MAHSSTFGRSSQGHQRSRGPCRQGMSRGGLAQADPASRGNRSVTGRRGRRIGTGSWPGPGATGHAVILGKPRTPREKGKASGEGPPGGEAGAVTLPGYQSTLARPAASINGRRYHPSQHPSEQRTLALPGSALHPPVVGPPSLCSPCVSPLGRACPVRKTPDSFGELAEGLRTSLPGADAEDLGPALWAGALGRWPAVLQRYPLGILDGHLGATLETIGFHSR